MAKLLPDDARRAALSAGLLASHHDGEVVAAARPLVGILRKGDLDPASVVSAGLTEHSPAPAISVSPCRYPPGFSRPWNDRARMARSCPRLNDWERGFLGDICHLRTLTAGQESKMKAILAKAERA